MLVIQILLIIFFLFAIGRVIGRFRAGELSWALMAGWVLFWVVAGVVVVLPNSTFYLAELVGVHRGADVVVYLSLAAIFFLLFRLMAAIERLKKEVTILTRTVALQEHPRAELAKPSTSFEKKY